MWTLGIETSGRAGSVALLHQGVLVADRQLAATGRRHARSLVPEIRSMLASHSVDAAELDVVAVSIGPGSFTGLRVGVVCAKTLAYALPKSRLVAVDTFLAVAASAPADVDRVAVIDDALRGDLFAGEYLRTEGGWTCLQAPRLVEFSRWRRGLPPGIAVSGPGIEKRREELDADLRLVPEEFLLPQARQIATLGEIAARSGRADDPWTVQPVYIRRSAAEEKGRH